VAKLNRSSATELPGSVVVVPPLVSTVVNASVAVVKTITRLPGDKIARLLESVEVSLAICSS
jgi:hypothetical protein